MLNKLEIKGFKSIKEMQLELRSLNILIGANGVGKSNFISLFRLINNISEQNLQLFISQSGGVDSVLHFSQKTTNKLFVKLDFGANSYQFSLVPTKDNTLAFSEEICLFNKPDYRKEPYPDMLGSGHRETKLNDAVKRQDKVGRFVADAIKSWKVYHFHDTSDSSKMKQFGNINDNSILRPDASNLAAYLFLLNEKYPLQYKNIIETIRMVAPFFDDFILRPNPLKEDDIQLEWRHKESNTYFNAHSLSDGTLRFICLATLLLQPKKLLPSAILLDEPELGLHPYAITLLANLLQSTATKTQIIVSTQSVTLVNRFKPEDMIVVEMDKGQSYFSRLKKEDMDHWLEEYGIGDLWEKNILGGRPK